MNQQLLSDTAEYESLLAKTQIDDHESLIYRHWKSLKIASITYRYFIDNLDMFPHLSNRECNRIMQKFLGNLLSAKKKLTFDITLLIPKLNVLIRKLSDTHIKGYLNDCIQYLNEQMVPEPAYDWRVYDDSMIPKPIIWIACLMLDPRREIDSYGIKDYLNCIRPSDFDKHPIRDHQHTELYGHELNPQKAIEALAFIFNDIDSDWQRKDLRTQDEIYQDEINFYGDDFQHFTNKFEKKVEIIKRHLIELGPDYIKSKEEHRIKFIKYDRMSRYMQQALSLLCSNFTDNEMKQLLLFNDFIDEEANASNQQFQKMIKDEERWYESQTESEV